MTRAFVVISALLSCVFGASGCREEPAIVIKFEPNDLAAARPTADLSARLLVPPADLGLTPAAAAAAKAKDAKRAGECKVAADCVLEPTTCCDCANGGKQQAVSKKQGLADKAAHAEKCKTAVCTMMMSTDPSCGQRADCVAGVCQMVKK
jgi:hypothetical protein